MTIIWILGAIRNKKEKLANEDTEFYYPSKEDDPEILSYHANAVDTFKDGNDAAFDRLAKVLEAAIRQRDGYMGLSGFQEELEENDAELMEIARGKE